MEENKPPVAVATKLKQAKLSFFKSTPVSVKTNIHGQGKKRRNSGSSCLDSPTKSSKSGKPLNPIATDNTECQSAKAHKIRKICTTKDNDGNDHEVSSSSEAEAGNIKCGSGNFMDRFVCKKPQDPQQEISSTNEMFEMLQQNESPNDDSKIAAVKSEPQTHCLQPTEPDCIIIDETDVCAEKSNANLSKNEGNEATESVSANNEICNEGLTSIQCDGKKLENVNICQEGIGNSNSCEVVDNSVFNVNSSASDKDTSALQEYNPDDSIKDVSVDRNNLDDSLKDISAEGDNLDDSVKDVSMQEDLDDSVKDISADNDDLDDSVKDVSADDNLDDSVKDVSADDNLDDSVKDVSADDNLDDSVRDVSVLSETCSTPIRNTPATPATSSAKRRTKVDSEQKAEREMMKLKREAERLERKRKLEAEKAEKERVKKEKKDAKEKQRQEQKEKLEKEKQEKERAREEEKKKKEEEKLKKEEEKKKKHAALEAKQEEKRKKEEEKRLKEEEKLKEEEDKKKKNEKTKQVFQSFFIKPKDNTVKPVAPKSSTGIFIPFELKKDMHLAPAVRRDALTEDKKHNLDQILAIPDNVVNTYLEQLKNGVVTPHRTGRILRTNPQPEEDVEVVYDPEALKKVTHIVKILQFHTDYRPPYYGTWRKKPALSPRNPWKKDETVFDYDVDSDEEWEEEEPGESLSCSDGEEEKGEDAEEDDDDGWMVPHGYLSEDEGCNEDDEITPEKLKLQQLAKAKAWEEEQKRKLRVAPSISIACFFENSPSCMMTGDVRLLYEFQAVVLATVPVQTNLFGCSEPEKSEEIDAEGVAATPSQKGFKKQSVPDEAMPDLIRLVHGNTSGIKRLIREFRVYWLRKVSPPANLDQESFCEKSEAEESFCERNSDVSGLNESVSECCNAAEIDGQLGDNDNGSNEDAQKKVKEEGFGCSISKRQLELKITSMACREKRPGFNKICWYVHENVLAQFCMSDIKLPNSWVHILPRPVRLQVTSKASESPAVSEPQTPKTNKNAKISAKNKVSKSEGSTEVTTESIDNDKLDKKETQLKRTNKDQRSIKDFACCKEELTKQPANLVSVLTSENSPALPQANTQQVVKDTKKLNAQKSIVEFSGKPESKNNYVCRKLQVSNLSKENSEVISVDSDNEQGDTKLRTHTSKSVTCGPAISEVCMSSTVEPENEPSSLKKPDIKMRDNLASVPKRLNSPVLSKAQEALKDNKKPSAQKSIMEFTSKSTSKKLPIKKCKPKIANNILDGKNQEVICIDSDHEQGSHLASSQPASCSDITVAAISGDSVVLTEQVLSNTLHEEAMEVNEGTTCQDRVVDLSRNNDTGSSDEMECGVTG